jgi:acylphosphatase
VGNIRRRVLVRGRVQGVGFRYWARSKAGHLGVNGWVRNRSDGSVEAEVEGEPVAVSEMIDALGRGPAGAVVSDVEVSDRPPEGEAGFEIRSGDHGGMSGWFRRGTE